MLFVRFLCSVGSEIYRQKRLKKIFIDSRDTFKIFAINRYLFKVGVALPVLVFANMYLQFRGTIIAIIVSILGFQEAVVGFMIIFKIRRAQLPAKMQFVERRYCSPDLERQIRIIFEE